MNARQKEIETIEIAIRKRDKNETISIAEDGTAHDNECLFNHTETLEYNLYVLPTEDIVSAYINQSQQHGWDEGDKWFYNSELVSRAGEMYRNFLDFYKVNRAHLKTCFLIKLKRVSKNDSNPIRMSAYSQGDILTDDVSLPKKPPLPKKVFVSYNQIKFNVLGIQPDEITKWIFVKVSKVSKDNNTTDNQTSEHEHPNTKH